MGLKEAFPTPKGPPFALIQPVFRMALTVIDRFVANRNDFNKSDAVLDIDAEDEVLGMHVMVPGPTNVLCLSLHFLPLMRSTKSRYPLKRSWVSLRERHSRSAQRKIVDRWARIQRLFRSRSILRLF